MIKLTNNAPLSSSDELCNNQFASYKGVHQDLQDTFHLVYEKNQFKYSQPISDKESKEYGAYKFKLNGLFVIFRVAKITPKKAGQFVTLWKRIGNFPIQPYDFYDSIDLFVISVRKESLFGQFVFPKSVLSKKNIISVEGKGGKRGIRIYPPWDITTSKQAKQTQSWQLKYFIEISQDGFLDYLKIQTLYSKK